MSSGNWKHLIAAILLIGAFTLRGLGIDTITSGIITAVALVYLGVDLSRIIAPDRRRH